MKAPGEPEPLKGLSRDELSSLARMYAEELDEAHWLWVFARQAQGASETILAERRLQMIHDALGPDEFCAALSEHRRKWDAIFRDAEAVLRRCGVDYLEELGWDHPEVQRLIQRTGVHLHCISAEDLRPIETLRRELDDQREIRDHVDRLLNDLNAGQGPPPGTPH